MLTLSSVRSWATKLLPVILSSTIGLWLLIILGHTLYESTQRKLVIEPISVSANLEASGVTSRITSLHLKDAISDIITTANTASLVAAPASHPVTLPTGVLSHWAALSRTTYTSIVGEWAEPDIEVPGLGFSYSAAKRFLRYHLGLPETRITGEIVQVGDAIYLRLRINDTPLSIGLGRPYPIDDLQLMFRPAAEQILFYAEPLLLAYYFGVKNDLRYIDAIKASLSSKNISTVSSAYNLWGDILAANGKIREARFQYERALDKDKASHAAYLKLASLLIEQATENTKEFYSESLELIKKAHSINRHDWRVYLVWGNWYHKQAFYKLKDGEPLPNAQKTDEASEFFQNALRMYETAARQNPKEAWIYYNLGFAMEQQGKSEEAIEYYTHTISIAPNFIYAYARWADILARETNYRDAIAVYEVAESHLDERSHARHTRMAIYNNLAHYLHETKQYIPALRRIRQGIAAEPGDGTVYLTRAEIELTMQRPEAARISLKKAIFRYLWRINGPGRGEILKYLEIAFKLYLAILEQEQRYAETLFWHQAIEALQVWKTTKDRFRRWELLLADSEASHNWRRRIALVEQGPLLSPELYAGEYSSDWVP